MALFFERGEEIEEVRTERGLLVVWTLGPSIYVTELKGHMQMPHVEKFLAYSERRTKQRPGKLYAFHEWTEMTG